MNTKTIEEKAKAYDEAIEKAKKRYNEEYTSTLERSTLAYVFPALKESEDERIRGNIIATIHLYYGEPLEDEAKEMIAWLEKQGKNNMGISEATKQKLEDNLNKALEKETPESWNEFLEKQGEQKKKQYQIYESTKDRFYKEGVEDGILIGIKKQKPAWSEEDKMQLDAVIHLVSSTGHIETTNWLKSLKDRVQPKQEWNEDTQQWIDAIIKDYEGWYDADKDHRATIQVKINILKSLGPQSAWKPSDEQMEALSIAMCGVDDPLFSLYQDLLKLKG